MVVEAFANQSNDFLNGIIAGCVYFIGSALGSVEHQGSFANHVCQLILSRMQEGVGFEGTGLLPETMVNGLLVTWIGAILFLSMFFGVTFYFLVILALAIVVWLFLDLHHHALCLYWRASYINAKLLHGLVPSHICNEPDKTLGPPFNYFIPGLLIEFLYKHIALIFTTCGQFPTIVFFGHEYSRCHFGVTTADFADRHFTCAVAVYLNNGFRPNDIGSWLRVPKSLIEVPNSNIAFLNLPVLPNLVSVVKTVSAFHFYPANLVVKYPVCIFPSPVPHLRQCC